MYRIQSRTVTAPASGGRRWAYLLLLAGCPLAGVAADNPAPTETIPQHRLFQDAWRFTVGGYYASTNTNARFSPSSGGAGVDVNFEDALGLDDRKLVAEGSMQWRFAERWRLDVEYFAITRRATRTLSQQIVWGDQTFTAGTDVNSKFRISDLRAAVGYSFFRRSDKELGLGLGLHTTGLQASIDASGVGAEAGEVLAPLPVVNFYGSFALTDTWAMTTRLDWLSLSYSDYDGAIRSVAVDFLYQPFEHVGFGFGWHSLLIDLSVDKADWRGTAALAYQGPAVYLTFSF